MDEQYLLTTPENVPISYELAGVGSRFVAALLDTLIISLIEFGLFALYFIASMLVVVVSAVGTSMLDDASSLAAFLYAAGLASIALLSFGVLLGYPLLFEIVWNGQTPGKRLTGIRVVRGDGGPITALAVVIRNVMRLVDFLPVYYITGVTAMLIDKKARRLGDMAAGVICVKEHRDVALDRLSLLPHAAEVDELTAENGFANLHRLTYDDYHLVKEYLLRCKHLAPAATHSLAIQIADHVTVKLGVDLADELPEAFLVRLGSALERQGGR